MMNTAKPIKTTCGGFETDSNFGIELFTQTQVNQRARARLKRSKKNKEMCTKWSVIDKGEYWAISIH